jgi:hypothetical protein
MEAAITVAAVLTGAARCGKIHTMGTMPSERIINR